MIDGDVKALRDERKVGVEIFDLFAQEIARNRGIVVDKQAAFAVEEFAARGEDGNLADPVGFGERTEVVGVEHLETPKAGEEDGEYERDEVLDGVQLADGQLFRLVAGSDVLALGVRMVKWFHTLFQSTTGAVGFALPLLCIKVVR